MTGHTYKRGKTWTYVIDVGRDGATGKRKQRSKGGFRTKKQAEAAMNKAIGLAAKGELAQPSKETVAEFLEEWLEHARRGLRISSYDRYRRDVTLNAIPHIGGIRLAELNGDHIRELYRTLEAGSPTRAPLSPTTVRHFAHVLHRALHDAVRWGRVPRNATEHVKPPRKAHHEPTTWTTDQLQTFLTAVSGHRLQAAFVLAATTGMRQGEIMGLQWGDIDLNGDPPRLSVRRSVVRANGHVELAHPKTPRGVRSIPLGPTTVEMLRAHKIEQQHEHEELRRIGIEPVPDFVFTAARGGVMKHGALYGAFRDVAAQAGLPPIRFHDLRHTFATRSLELGRNVKTISDLLGHANVAFTLSTYAHAVPSMEVEAVNRFEAAVMPRPSDATPSSPLANGEHGVDPQLSASDDVLSDQDEHESD